MAPPAGSPRQVVVAALTPLGWPIVQGRWPDNISRRTLVITVSTIEPQGVGSLRDWTVTTTVLSPVQGETADDDLEAAVIEVLAALDAAQPARFTGGRRAVVQGDAYNAYDLDSIVTTQRSPSP